MNNLIFKDETSTIALRAGSGSDAGTGSSRTITRHPSPDHDELARQFFFRHFVTPHSLAFLEGATPDDFLMKPVTACALAALANGSDDQSGREKSRQHYVDAITATNIAIRDPRKIKEDDTLISVYLLACYERVSWDIHTAENSWKHHIEGAAQLLWLRGPNQLNTRAGALLFRELRDSIVNNCILSEQQVPTYLIEWTKRLDFDSALTPSDHIALLAARTAALRAAFCNASMPDAGLSSTADALERDLLSWAKRHSVQGSVCAFETVCDPRSQHSYNGLRHVYGSPQARKHWSKFRCIRISVSRVQEALWRRSWPTLTSRSRPVPQPEHFKAIRNQMVEEVCIAAAHDLGNDSALPAQSGSVASGLMLTFPLALSGTCLVEQLSELTVSPGGRRLIRLNKPLHLDTSNPVSTQLAWIIDRIDYIANELGVRWAGTVSSFLKGETGAYYEICRSHIVRNEELDAAIFGELLDLDSTLLGTA